MLKKLKIKFVAITMAVATLMLCVIFATVYSFTSRSLETESLQMMEAIAADPFQMDRLGGGGEQVRLPYFALQIGPFGEVLASGGGYFDLSDEAYLQEVIGAALQAGGSSGVLKDYGLRYCWGGSRLSRCLVFADMSSERATLTNLLQSCAIIGAASLLAFLGLSVLLARWAVRPVEKAWEQQRQFVSDASHELKTPLTVILTNAELLEDAACDGPTRQRLWGSMVSMAQQMRGLVESLLELARVDGGVVRSALVELDYSALASEASLPFEPLYYEQGLGLDSQIEKGLRVKGSAAHLKQAEEILLDNALKYAAPGSTVELRLKRQGQHALLSVASQGEELSKEELKNIFKRFYRADKARSAGGSYGLGLAIAESIVTEHGGKIWAESGGGFNRFFIQLPAL